MEAPLIYISKVALSVGVFYLAFLVLFKNQKHFVFNRLYLPVSLAISFIIPLITFTSIKYVEPVPVGEFNGVPASTQLPGIVQNQKFFLEWTHYLFGIYILGFVVLLFQLVFGHFKAIQIVRKSTVQELFKKQVNITKKDVHPFSFFNKIVLSGKTLNHPNLEIIVDHENIHVKEKHTIDILISEILFLFQWFNPFAWLIKDAIKNNLEYYTDNEIAQKHNPQTYQLAMVSLADKKELAPFLTALNGNQIKSRIIMMKKKTKNKYSFAKQLLILPLLSVLVMGLSNKVEKIELINNNHQTNEIKGTKTEFYKVVIDGNEINTNTPEMQHLNLSEILDAPAAQRAPGFFSEVSCEILTAQNINPDKLERIRYSGRYPNISTLFIRTKDYAEGTNPKFEKEINRYSAGVTLDTYKTEQKERIEENTGNGTSESSDWKISGPFRAVNIKGSENQFFTPTTEKGIMLELDGNKNKRPLLFVDGVETKSIEHLNPEQFKSITVIKDEASLNKYGDKGKNGVIEIFLKSETFEAEQKFRELISKKIKFPEEALSANIEKTLSFSVRIDENGNLSRDAFVPEINIYQPIVVIGKRVETNEAKPKNTISEVEKAEIFSKEFSRVVREIKQVDLDELKGKSMLVNFSFKIEDVELTSKNLRIGKLTWKNNELFNDDKLNDLLGVEKGNIYSKEYIEQRIYGEVSDLYLDNGYLFFNISITEIEQKKGIIDLYFNIYEGNKFKVGKIDFTGYTDVLPNEVLKKLQLKSGDFFSRTKLNQSAETLNNLIKSNALVGDIEVHPLLDNSDIVNLTFKIKEKIEDVEINSKNSEPITSEFKLREYIRKRVYFPPEARDEHNSQLHMYFYIKINRNGEVTNVSEKPSGEVVEINEIEIIANRDKTAIPELSIKNGNLMAAAAEQVLHKLPIIDIPELKGKTAKLHFKFVLLD